MKDLICKKQKNVITHPSDNTFITAFSRSQKSSHAFATGDVIALKEVNDGVFSAGIMGEGFAIIPENETIYAPADATVNLLMQESRHASIHYCL